MSISAPERIKKLNFLRKKAEGAEMRKSVKLKLRSPRRGAEHPPQGQKARVRIPPGYKGLRKY
jgi:hypothetical protein